MGLAPSGSEVQAMLRGYKRKDFESRYKEQLASALEQIIREDVGVTIYAIGEAAKAIRPDPTVDNRHFAAGEITKKVMVDATSSFEYRRLKRLKYLPAGAVISPQTFRTRHTPLTRA